MVALLQGFQETLGQFVVPVVFFLTVLLFVVLAVYIVAVWINWKKRKNRENLKRNWGQSLQEAGRKAKFDDLPEATPFTSDYRDEFLESLKASDLTKKELSDIYRETEYYDKDRNELAARSWWQRVQAIYRLKFVPPDGFLDKLASLVHDPSHEVRLVALDSLSYLGELPKLDPIELFEIFGEKLDRYLLIKLLALGPDKTFLNPLVESESTRLRLAGATLLGQPKETDFIPLLKKLTKDRNKSVRRRAAESLGRVGTSEVIPILEQTSKDITPAVREASARSLGKVSDEKAIEILDELAADDDFRTRLAAFSSLSHYGEAGRDAIGNHWSENRSLAREVIFESYQE